MFYSLKQIDNVTSDPSLDWYSWGPWSPCSSACGLGVRWRRRACLKEPRSCPQSSRPNSLFYEKTQIQDCQLSPCVNRTLAENSLVSTSDVGTSIAISSSIIALVFIVAKTLHCMTESRSRRGCCKNAAAEETSSSEATFPESIAPPLPIAQPRSGIENMAGPVYITITQEMITGDTASIPAGTASPGAQAATPPVPCSRTDVRVARAMSSPGSSSRRNVINMCPNGNVSFNLNPTNSLIHIPIPGQSEAVDITLTNSERDTGESNGRSPIPSESDSVYNNTAEREAVRAVYSPPSYESIFPLYKRNQTL